MIIDNLKKYKYYSLFALSAINSFRVVFDMIDFSKTGNVILSVVFYIVLAFFVLCSFSEFKKSFLNPIFCLVSGVFVLTFFTMGLGKGNILTTILVLACVRESNIKKVIKIIIIPKAVLFFIYLFFVGVKIIPDEIRGVRKKFGILIERHSLGHSSPNCNFWMLFPCYAGYLFIRKKVAFWELAIHFALFYTLYCLTYCRAGFYCVTILITSYFLYSFFPKAIRNLFSLRIVKYIFIVLCITSLALCLIVKNLGTEELKELTRRYLDGQDLNFWEKLLVKLDLMSSSRILNGAKAIEKYGISLFGQNVDYEMYVDNSFIKLLTSYGVLFTYTLLISMYYTIKKLQNEKETLALIIICIFALYFVFEQVFFNVMDAFIYLFAVSRKKREKLTDKSILAV
ncbi:MAG TPA: hypothetical protein DDY82_03895 [Clostridiales bacterium]|nr:hypothetical protein [Clostridiales bacterium]